MSKVTAEARRLAREARAKVSEAMTLLDAGDYDRAYAAAEAAQHAAYELKSEIDVADWRKTEVKS